MKSWLVAAVCVFGLTSCGKEHSGIPDVYVNYRFTEAEFDSKRTAGNVMLVPNQGVAGLIICKSPDGRSFVAFDRCSTVDPEKRCAVTVDESGFTATDPCSGGKFSLFDGAPSKAPAKISLKQYAVLIGNNGYTVTN